MKKKKEEIEKFDKKLQKHIEKKDLMKIFRTFPEGESSLSGFILDLSGDFLLLQNEDEFYLNGYTVLPKTQFDSIRCAKFDQTIKRILEAEGILEKDYGIKDKIALDSWASVFKDLQQRDFHVIVECEELKRPLFIIGEIIAVGAKNVEILNYDATGKLDKKPTALKYKDITSVKFGDRYSSVFRKYLKEKKAKTKTTA